MKLGRVMVMVAILGGGTAVLGCSHEAKPVVAPDEHAPLPPASGTVIGQLVDRADALKLNESQVTQLREISDHLASQLATDDGGLRADAVGPSAAPPKEEGRGLGFRAGGQHQDGSYGGGQVFPNSGNPDLAGTTRGYDVAPAAVSAVQQARASHTRDAIRRALGLLDAGQQTGAKQILVDHGVDPDTGRQLGAEPGQSAMEPPKLNQPLPREP